MNAHTVIPTLDQVRAGWDRIAPGFDRFATPLTFSLGELALDRIGLEPGMRFLDIATGSGALAIPAARRGARVVASDIAPGMVERLLTRVRDEGLSNVDARVMDGSALDLEDDACDVAGSQNGVSLFPDVQRGLREMVRVTRPGGRVLVVAFGPIQAAEFVTFFIAALKASVPGFQGLPADPPPPPFRLGDPATLRQELAEAGLSDISVETVDWPVELESGAHFWDAATVSNPIAAGLVADLTAAQIADVQRVMEGMLSERSGGGAAVLHNQMNIGIGTK